MEEEGENRNTKKPLKGIKINLEMIYKLICHKDQKHEIRPFFL